MKLIKQRTNDDCAIADLAMVAGVSYSKAYQLVRPHGDYKWLTGTCDDEICWAMRSLGIDCERTEDKRALIKLGRPAIVCIDLSNSIRPLSHAVAYDPKSNSILDPGWYKVGYSLVKVREGQHHTKVPNVNGCPLQ
jgi:ABC-type bacteriocin/lantibiotic exporter with double-glycine peptidase domain